MCFLKGLFEERPDVCRISEDFSHATNNGLYRANSSSDPFAMTEWKNDRQRIAGPGDGSTPELWRGPSTPGNAPEKWAIPGRPALQRRNTIFTSMNEPNVHKHRRTAFIHLFHPVNPENPVHPV